MICVVGAPRSGTTSPWTYLADHPDVRFSCVKQPHFFSRFDLGEPESGLRERIESESLEPFFPGWRTRKRVLDWNKVPARPAALPPELRERISEKLRDDRDRPAALLGRRLDHWLSPTPRHEPAFQRSIDHRRNARLVGHGVSGPPSGSG